MQNLNAYIGSYYYTTHNKLHRVCTNSVLSLEFVNDAFIWQFFKWRAYTRM